MNIHSLGFFLVIASIGLVVGPKEKIKPLYRKAGLAVMAIGFGLMIFRFV